MKIYTHLLKAFLPITLIAAFGCSTIRGEKSGQELATSGPTVVNPRSNPSVIELNRNFQPMQPAEILADVTDFTSRVTNVKLRFLHAPLEIPMQHVRGTTWRAVLTPEQIRTLAVGGQTTQYEATVIAKNEDGQVAYGKDNVAVTIKAPDLAQRIS